MENQTPSIKTTIINYALILSAISIAFNLMLYFLDMHYQQSQMAGIVGIVIMIGVLIYSFIDYKKLNEGYLSLSEALKIGLGISALAGLIGVAYTFVLTEFLDPNMMFYARKIFGPFNSFCFPNHRFTFYRFHHFLDRGLNR